jgi:hypothetical protein
VGASATTLLDLSEAQDHRQSACTSSLPLFPSYKCIWGCCSEPVKPGRQGVANTGPPPPPPHLLPTQYLLCQEPEQGGVALGVQGGRLRPSQQAPGSCNVMRQHLGGGLQLLGSVCRVRTRQGRGSTLVSGIQQVPNRGMVVSSGYFSDCMPWNKGGRQLHPLSIARHTVVVCRVSNQRYTIILPLTCHP